MRIALAGNPNSGKTTMFNALTGSSERVGNWAGVTVDSKQSPVKKRYTNGLDVVAVDLPGAYSMSAYTSEESITSTYVRENNPDVIINIVDSTNLSRSLFFTTQLLELGVPVVVALNKVDVNEKKQTIIDIQELSRLLNCPVVETISTVSKGLELLISTAVSLLGTTQTSPYEQASMDGEDKDAMIEADKDRFDFVNDIVRRVETKRPRIDNNLQDKIDAILTNRWVGIPIFALVMFLVFGISQAWLGPWLADLLAGWLEAGQSLVADALAGSSGQLDIWSSILVDGIIGGLIAVVGFLPLVMVMYFLIALLEDCGYMSRASVILDPIFKKVGLSGKSIIPFIIGTGCAVPGVMACRTIRDDKERKATAMLTPFMPCGAKLPVIALFAGVFFGDSPWVGTIMYFVGIAIIILGALLVKLITGVKNKKSYFIIELPEYKSPSLLGACKSMLSRGWAYIVKAGTVILVCNFVVHLMQTFDWSFQVVGEGAESTSILATISSPIAYIIAPFIGVVAWQMAAATVTGFIAKENLVGTLAVCYGVTNFINVDDMILESGASEVAAIFAITKVAGLAFLAFNLFSPPCFAAIGAMSAEIKDKRWFWAGIGMQLSIGYAVAFLIYFVGTLITGGVFGEIWMPILGWIILLGIVAVYTILILKNRVKKVG
ncbi:MAG: ferrous iron transporter B [Clostridia bacterium]|nr:ferrous iron transporter B [Clostridia bacterium]